ncbi:hypothetical protein [Enhygromyxa salina]|uniref:Uncharacterized protein n=1 Tax=Enhygromyxa salina TaxID=215803 RepID=A0A2S9Y656_9BACT|nr:hypothetical protein [Enhygromyxa salina]PRQ00536.1 hypothetical protein ENSA7_60300 [Enhygromyxa salina]
MNDASEHYPEICELLDALANQAPDMCLDEVRSLLKYSEQAAALEDLCVAVDEYEMTHTKFPSEIRRMIALQCEACKIDEKYWRAFRIGPT